MSLFSGMEKFGLGKYEYTKVVNEKKPKPVKKVKVKIDEKKPEEHEAEALFDKHFVCPVCDTKFSSKFVRTGKVRISGKDTDLRPIYEGIDPLKYDVVACGKCGYAALTKYFGKLSTRQIKDIRNQIGANFSGLEYEQDIYTYDEAINRYKLALLTSVVKNAKNSERGYVCLKFAWILRGKRQTLDENDPEYEKLYKDELDSIANAYQCFNLAISNEEFPIAGMDENTLQYVMADLARRLHKYEDSARLLGNVILSKTVSSRLKEQALLLKEIIKEDMKKNS